MIDIVLLSASELCVALATRLRARRLTLGITQIDLARRAGINVGTVHNIESKGGATSLESIVRVAVALGLVDQFQSLFEVPVKSIADMERRQAIPRQRARPVRRT